MSKLAAFLGANSGPIFGTAVFAVGALGAGSYLGLLSPQDAALPLTQENVAQEIALPAEDAPKVIVAKPGLEATPDVSVDPNAKDEPIVGMETEVATFVPRAPSVDEVRSEPDGLTILAGRGEPSAEVTLLVNNVENMNVKVGNDGAFAIVAFLDPTSNPTVLSVIQRTGDIELVAADIILAPQVVAQGEAAETTQVVGETASAQVAVGEPLVSADAGAGDLVASDELAVAGLATLAIESANVKTAAKDEAASKQPTTEVAILKSDEDGVQIINRSSAPEVMSNVEIDTISYSEQGDVLLSGRAQSAATSVRVYLDNAAVTTLEVDPSGRWRGDLPNVDTGVYTLRVDEVDADGAVTSRVETPFKRESPEVLAASGGTTDAPAKAITVQTGATLWAIARDRYGDGTLFVRVFEANADTIKDADLIYPGQVFDLPD